MAKFKRGKSSFLFTNRPVIASWASIAGKKEAEGPLGQSFDKTSNDTLFGQKTWEQAEKKMQELALKTMAEKAGLHTWEIDLVYSGDLLNQCIGSSFSLRNMNIPHLGLYGACSTMAESLLMAALTVDGGYADRVAALTSSHFASSERQYRFPLGYGGQRTPTAQWTVTGSGSVLVTGEGKGPRILSGTVGTVRDLGIKDAGNMGAAMAPVDVKRRPYPIRWQAWFYLHTQEDLLNAAIGQIVVCRKSTPPLVCKGRGGKTAIRWEGDKRTIFFSCGSCGLPGGCAFFRHPANSGIR